MVKACSPHLGFSGWKEEQYGGGIPLLRPEEAGTYHIYSYIIGDNLVIWLHQYTRKTGKCDLIMCPGIRVGEYWWAASFVSYSLQLWLLGFCAYPSLTHPFCNTQSTLTCSPRGDNSKFHPVAISS